MKRIKEWNESMNGLTDEVITRTSDTNLSYPRQNYLVNESPFQRLGDEEVKDVKQQIADLQPEEESTHLRLPARVLVGNAIVVVELVAVERVQEVEQSLEQRDEA